MDLPSHPEADDSEAGTGPAAKNWGTVLVVVAVGLVLAAVVILHLTGVVGPAAR